MSHSLTTRQIADEISASPFVKGAVREWQVRRLYEDGNLREPERFGGKRIIDRAQLPRIVNALRERGWLPTENEEVVST